MISQKMYRAIGVGIPIVSAVALFGIGIEATTNLFNTGITIGVLLGLANLFIAYSIWKNRI